MLVDLPVISAQPSALRNFRMTDWEEFRRELELKLGDLPKPLALSSGEALLTAINV